MAFLRPIVAAHKRYVKRFLTVTPQEEQRTQSVLRQVRQDKQHWTGITSGWQGRLKRVIPYIPWTFIRPRTVQGLRLKSYARQATRALTYNKYVPRTQPTYIPRSIPATTQWGSQRATRFSQKRRFIPPFRRMAGYQKRTQVQRYRSRRPTYHRRRWRYRPATKRTIYYPTNTTRYGRQSKGRKVYNRY